ncbi:hypothetical protein M4D58_03135 [Brevibacillus borstelensis]|uniref:glycoside hydrolase family 78 protein n=1 Tax=Brevibacillus borstelensis TaxID=45462 RepID=UPI00203FD934|nr:hypothetical protein [Brevibacillus borstelensis]MCM3589623.1 hypothetical protein [Brevibacillus borstelensis]
MATVASFDKSQLNNTISFVEAENVYVAQNELSRAEFHPAGNKVAFQTKGFTIAWTPSSMGYVDESGLEDMIYSVQDAPLEIKGNKARFDRSMPDVDDLFIVDGDRLKHTIIVQGWQRDPVPWLSGKIDFVISGRLEFDPALSVHSSGMKLVGPFETGESIEIRNGEEVIFTLPKIVAFDSNIPERAEAFGKYRVTANENGTLDFGIVMDNSWMADESRVYPILIDPTVVVPNIYSTAGNGGRKIVMLSNGWIIAAVLNSGGPTLYFYVSKDKGQTWTQLCYINSSFNVGFAIASWGTYVYLLGASNIGSYNVVYSFNAVTQTNTNITGTGLDGPNNTFGECSLCVNETTNEIHAAFATKRPGQPNSFNIRYAKGIISSSGNVTWGSVQQLTSLDVIGQNANNPSVTVRPNGYPVVAWESIEGNVNLIRYKYWNGASWVGQATYGDILVPSVYKPSYPCIISDSKDVLHAVWQGYDVGDTSPNIWYSKSGDLSKWDTTKLTHEKTITQGRPTIGRSNQDHLYVFWHGGDPAVSTTGTNIRLIIYTTFWGDITTLTRNTTTATSANNPSVMEKEKDHILGWIYMDGQTSSVMFDSILFNVAPTAPTNLSPNGITIDRAVSNRFSWKHNDQNVGDGQSKFDLQWRQVGTSAWNTATQTTPNQYWNAPANTFPNGNIEWRVRTYDQAGLVSPYSAQAVFIAGDKPSSPTITGPSSPVPIANPTLEWSSFGQVSYQVQVLNTGRSVLWDSGEIQSSNKSRTIGISLANNTDYILRVRIKNADGLWSDWAERRLTVSYTTPPTPTLTVTGLDKAGKILITFKNPAPTGSQPSILYNDLFRREVGSNSWVRIATGIQANGVYDDFAVSSGVIYEYMGRACGNNGTIKDSLFHQGSIILSGVWLHCVDSPASTAYQFMIRSGYTDEWGTEGSLMQFAGRERPVAEFGEAGAGNIKVNLSLLKNKGDREALQKIVQRKTTICYRDNRGRKMFGVIFVLPSGDKFYGYDVSLSIDETDYREDV